VILAELRGDANALYLTHLFSIGLLRSGWVKLGLGGNFRTFLFIVTGLIVCMSIGVSAYLIVERPITRPLQRRLKGRLAVANA